MFTVAIRFKDAQPGDVLARGFGNEYEQFVVQQEPVGSPFISDIVVVVSLRLKNGGVLLGNPDELIGLIHRPYPEGMTGIDCLLEIRELTLQLHEIGRTETAGELLSKLREAIEAYELGKPLDTARGKPVEDGGEK